MTNLIILIEVSRFNMSASYTQLVILKAVLFRNMFLYFMYFWKTGIFNVYSFGKGLIDN